MRTQVSGRYTPSEPPRQRLVLLALNPRDHPPSEENVALTLLGPIPTPPIRSTPSNPLLPPSIRPHLVLLPHPSIIQRDRRIPTRGVRRARSSTHTRTRTHIRPPIISLLDRSNTRPRVPLSRTRIRVHLGRPRLHPRGMIQRFPRMHALIRQRPMEVSLRIIGSSVGGGGPARGRVDELSSTGCGMEGRVRWVRLVIKRRVSLIDRWSAGRGMVRDVDEGRKANIKPPGRNPQSAPLTFPAPVSPRNHLTTTHSRSLPT
jgi:hypothetical protein